MDLFPKSKIRRFTAVAILVLCSAAIGFYWLISRKILLLTIPSNYGKISIYYASEHILLKLGGAGGLWAEFDTPYGICTGWLAAHGNYDMPEDLNLSYKNTSTGTIEIFNTPGYFIETWTIHIDKASFSINYTERQLLGN